MEPNAGQRLWWLIRRMVRLRGHPTTDNPLAWLVDISNQHLDSYRYILDFYLLHYSGQLHSVATADWHSQ